MPDDLIDLVDFMYALMNKWKNYFTVSPKEKVWDTERVVKER